MKILIIPPRFPYPPITGDRHRCLHFIRMLSKNHSVYLATFYESQKDLEHLSVLEKFCEKIFPVRFQPWRSKLNLFAALIKRTPLNVLQFRSKKMEAVIKDILENYHLDIVIAGSMRMAQYFLNHNNVAKVIDYGDCFSMHLQRLMRHNRNLFYPVYLMERARIRRYEALVHEYSDKGIISSPVDREVLPKKKKVSVIPTSFDINCDIKDQEECDPFSIIFSGNVGWFSDEIAILFFVKKILPLIKQKIPKVKFYIVGANPSRKVKKLANESIVVTGFVPKIETYLRRACISVAPMQVGGGILCKVVEPMIIGTPVIVSSVANGGIRAKDGQHIMVADTPREFAQKTIELLTDKILREKIAKNARKFVEAHFSEDVILEKIEKINREAIDLYFDRR